MAHTCPDCGSYCTCLGDWDDVDFGVNMKCICCVDDLYDDYEDDDLWGSDDDDERNDPNDSRNL